MKQRLLERAKKNLKFKMFIAQEIRQNGYLSVPLSFHYQTKKKLTSFPADGSATKPKFKGIHKVQLDDELINEALNFLFKKASNKVQHFNSKEKITKISVENEGILFCRSRIFEGQRFILAGDLKNSNILMETNLNFFTPVLDRFSPLSYSIAMYVHYELMKHSGEETCYRCSLGHCYIIQGMGLFKEISEDCVQCKQLRKKFIEVSMGGISDSQLTIAPPFWVSMVDLLGPIHVYVPGFERNTGNRKVLEAKVYIMAFVCPTTKNINLQVIETKSTEGILDGITRLGCEHGVPKYFLVDQESSIVKALNEMEVDMRDLQLKLHKESGIEFKVCPVGGHNFHGLVERKIRSVQDGLQACGFDKLRVHATGVQTLASLIANDINNIPLGYAYGRDENNSPLLRLLSPNMLRLGRNNSRDLDGPVKLPSGPREIMENVEKCYSGWFKIWNNVLIPKLMRVPKWFKTDKDLKDGDIVYFQKRESELGSGKWIIGQVENVTKGKDGLIREASIRYQNHNENHSRITDRAVRKLVKLFSIDDASIQQEMQEVEDMLKELGVNIVPRTNQNDEETQNNVATMDSIEETEDDLGTIYEDALKMIDNLKLNEEEANPHLNIKSVKVENCQKCCCKSHCQINLHMNKAAGPKIELMSWTNLVDSNSFSLKEDLQKVFDYEEDLPSEVMDPLTALMMAVNVDLDY